MEKQNLESLFIQSYSGKATPEEEQIILRWLDESEENKVEYEAYKKLWEGSQSLMLSGLVDTDTALLKTKNQIPQFTRKIRWIFVLKQAAAVLALSVIFSVVVNSLLNRQPQEEGNAVVYQEIKAAFGTQTRLTLADGTVVWLNSGSTLRFPLSFQHTENRQVDLKGEGYFEVAKNSRKPFIVKACSLLVKVTGTSFNVNAYEEEKHIEVALIEGKVELLKQVKGNAIQVTSLNPSDVADYETGNNQIHLKRETEIDRYTAWKEGKIVFFDDPVEKVVSRLENWYNVDIEIADNRLLAYHFTATFGQESLDQVLKYLSISTPLNYKFVPPSEKDNRDGKRTKIIVFAK